MRCHKYKQNARLCVCVCECRTKTKRKREKQKYSLQQKKDVSWIYGKPNGFWLMLLFILTIKHTIKSIDQLLLFFLLFFGPFGSVKAFFVCLCRLSIWHGISFCFMENGNGNGQCVFIVISPVEFQYKQTLFRRFVFAFFFQMFGHKMHTALTHNATVIKFSIKPIYRVFILSFCPSKFTFGTHMQKS